MAFRRVATPNLLSGGLITASISDVGAPIETALLSGALITARIQDAGLQLRSSILVGALIVATIQDVPDTTYPIDAHTQVLSDSLIQCFMSVATEDEPVYFTQGQLSQPGSAEGQVTQAGSAQGQITQGGADA